MFTGNWFATTYFPDPYFFGAGVDSGDLYAKWVKEGQPAYFMFEHVVYLAVDRPVPHFVRVERSENPDPNDPHRIWDQYYGPNLIYGRRR